MRVQKRATKGHFSTACAYTISSFTSSFLPASYPRITSHILFLALAPSSLHAFFPYLICPLNFYPIFSQDGLRPLQIFTSDLNNHPTV